MHRTLGNTFLTKVISRLYFSFRIEPSFPTRFEGTDIVGQLMVDYNLKIDRFCSFPTVSVENARFSVFLIAGVTINSFHQ